jgi:hypothetical protein
MIVIYILALGIIGGLLFLFDQIIFISCMHVFRQASERLFFFYKLLYNLALMFR